MHTQIALQRGVRLGIGCAPVLLKLYPRRLARVGREKVTHLLACRQFLRLTADEARYRPINVVIIAVSLIGLYLGVTGTIPRFVARLYRDLRWRYLLIALVIILLGGWSVTLARAVSERGGWG